MKAILLALVLSITTGGVSRADPPRVRIWPGGAAATTQGTALVDAPPAVVYATITAYAEWRLLFSDVDTVQVKSGGGRDATVQFRSRAMGHSVTVRFDNEEGRVIRFRLSDGPPGARARGEYVLEPSGTGTLVRATLYMDVKGMAGWFVSDGRVTRMRDEKLSSDLRDLVRRWLPRNDG